RAAVFNRQRDDELRSPAEFALDTDVTAHQNHEPFHDGKAETSAAVLSRARHIRLAELVEDVIQGLFFHADPCIRHRKPHHAVIARGGDFDLSLFGELHRATEEVQHDLLELI